jgi:hypothetical protein
VNVEHVYVPYLLIGLSLSHQLDPIDYLVSIKLVLKIDSLLSDRLVVQETLRDLLVYDHFQEVWELFDLDKLGSLRVKGIVGPELVELVDGVATDFQALFIFGRVKTLQDNGNEQVQEDERDNDHETDEKDHCFHRISTAFNPQCAIFIQHILVRRIFIAWEQDLFCSGTIVHDGLP